MKIKNTVIEDADIKDQFKSGLLGEFNRRLDLVTDSSLDSNILSEIWIKRPPSVAEFFNKNTGWFKEPLWPLQQEFVEAMVGTNPLAWNFDYDEGHAFWGKGAGKDRTISKLFAYILVKILHMRNPQDGFNYFLGGGLGIDAPIDIINVSKDARQAKYVFFANLKAVLKKVINPQTGRNFFEEVGVDLRETKDVQADKIPVSYTHLTLPTTPYV